MGQAGAALDLARSLHLQVLADEAVGVAAASHPLAIGSNSVGSQAENSIRLAASGVSRRHAIIELSADGLAVVDCGSKNGTMLNGVPVTRAPFVPGDELQFGPVRCLVQRVALSEELAVILELPVVPRSVERETALPALPIEAPAGWFELVLELLALLEATPQRWTPALARLGEELGARGVLLAGAGEEGMVVRAASGETRLDPAAERDLLAVSARLAGRAPAGDAVVVHGLGVVAARRRAGQVEMLLALGCEAPGAVALLTLALRLFCLPGGEPSPAPRVAPQLVLPPGHLPADSARMRSLYRELEVIAASDLPVLILGETGVGKEHVAAIIHLSSARRRGPLVAVNCAAIPDTLLESELFGVARGAATGVSERLGKFREAEGGTLFLDELGAMPLGLQAKLLRVLDEHRVQPVGGAAVKVDVRVVSATNVDLRAAASAGAFRSDLFYRVAGHTVEIPPLRERRGDLAALIEHLLADASRDAGKVVRGVTRGALDRLLAYPWPGNVRELQAELRRLAHLCPDSAVITLELLPRHLREAADGEPAPDPDDLDLEGHLRQVYRQLIGRALEATGGNRSAAARRLGISRNNLLAKLRELGI